MTKGDLANRVAGFFGPNYMSVVQSALVDVLWTHVQDAVDKAYIEGYDKGYRDAVESGF